MVEFPPTTLLLLKGKWYVNCTVPKDLRSCFSGEKQIRRSTRTADEKLALRRQHAISKKIYDLFAKAKPTPPEKTTEVLYELADLVGLPDGFEDAYLSGELEASDIRTLEALVIAAQHPMSSGDMEEDWGRERDGRKAAGLMDEFRDLVEVGSSSLSSGAGSSPGGTTSTPSSAPMLSKACKDYLDAVHFGREKTKRDVELSIERIVDFLGDLPLDDLTPSRMEGFAQDMHDKGAARQTISKRVVYVKGLLGHAVRKGWIVSNPLHSYRLDKKHGVPSRRRVKLEDADLMELFALPKLPDHIKTLFAILIATGMRLDEAVLLDWSDVKEEAGVTLFDLTGVDKILKTAGSARKLPLPDILLPLILPTAGRTGPMFPHFKRDADGKASTAASKVLMRHVRKVTKDGGKVVHSMRGSLKDLLRDAGVAKEINDFITGHSSGDTAGTYGSGPSLKVRQEALNKVKHPWLK
jgi:integrase